MAHKEDFLAEVIASCSEEIAVCEDYLERWPSHRLDDFYVVGNRAVSHVLDHHKRLIPFKVDAFYRLFLYREAVMARAEWNRSTATNHTPLESYSLRHAFWMRCEALEALRQTAITKNSKKEAA